MDATAPPDPAVRVMLGIEGDRYVGNCNITVIPSSSTSTLPQPEVDERENKNALTTSFFQRSLQVVASDVKVLSVEQVRRGAHYGHLVNYSYSYISPSMRARVHLRAELFSHSRPGRIFSFTCNTGGLSSVDAERAFEKERPAFEKMSISFRVPA